MSVKLIFKKFNNCLTVLFLSLGLFRVVTKDITLASFAVADDNFLSMQIIAKDGVTPVSPAATPMVD